MIILGTAGHIDHGKTTLVGSLTGIQTDRLKEEQERGISIELGFAYLDVPAGPRCGVIDVPGHERFVRQMIAGASGIDLVMLVVAADEGVMQQTREHFDICKLLGIARGLVVITKVDLVDAEWLELVESDVRDFVRGSFLDGAPVLHFSAMNPATHAPFKDAIFELLRQTAARVGRRGGDEPLRLPVDRVFTIRGFGTVVTGTVTSGRLKAGDAVQILPGGRRAKVRGIESHGAQVSEVTVGQRAAVNLQGVEKEDVTRGETLAHQGALEPTRMLDVDLHVLAHLDHPIEAQAKALVHVGTSQVTGTIVPLEAELVGPGETSPVQLRLDDWVVALGGDRVILRGFEVLSGFGKTFAGGVVRHPLPAKHKRGDPRVLAALEALRGDELLAKVEHIVRLTGHSGTTVAHVQQALDVSPAEAGQQLQALGAAGRTFTWVLDGTPRYVHREPFIELLTRAEAALSDYHARFPHRAGMPREELRSQIRADLPPRYFAELSDHLVARGTMTLVGQSVRRSDFVPSLTPVLERLRDAVLSRYRAAGLEPPSPTEVAESLAESSGAAPEDVREMTDLLISEGLLERLSESLVFATEHLRHMEKLVVAHLEQRGEMTTPELKELTGTTRKFTVPIGEYLDARKVTIRIGDVRRLRQ